MVDMDGGRAGGLLLILYASQTGNAQDVAERIAREARAHLADPRARASFSSALAAPVDAVPLSAWPRAAAIALAVSTTGQGEAPSNMRATWRRLLRRALPPDALRGVRYALFGLGDSGYVDFCAAALRLDRRLAALGASPLCARALGDDRAPGGGHEAALDPWLARKLWPALGCGGVGQAGAAEAAGGAGAAAAAAAAAGATPPPPPPPPLPPPRYRVSVLPPPPQVGASNGAADLSQDEREHAEAAEAAAAFRAMMAAAEARAAAAALGGKAAAAAQGPGPGAHGPWRPLMARLVVNRRVTYADHFQDTRHLEFDLTGYDEEWGGQGPSGGTGGVGGGGGGGSSTNPPPPLYEPGDVLAIFPRQPREDVDAVLRACGLSGEERLRIEEGGPQGRGGGGGGALPPATDADAPPPPPPQMEASARAVVAGVLDVSSAAPRRHLWEVLSAHAAEVAAAAAAAAAASTPPHGGSGPQAAAAAAAAAAAELARQRAERLALFASAAGREDAARYAWGSERRALAEIVRDFFPAEHSAAPDEAAAAADGAAPPTSVPPLPPPPVLPLARLLEACARLQPRMFSIASSPRAHGPRAAHVLAAVVAWRSPTRRPVRGLATGWLSSLLPPPSPTPARAADVPAAATAASTAAAGPPAFPRVPVWVERGEVLRPPADPSVPLLLVGPGTGVAPFRAILQERAALAAAAAAAAAGREGEAATTPPLPPPPVPCHLFFGCRSADADFYYREEWEGLVEAGALARDRGLVTAFSRPGGGSAGGGGDGNTGAPNGAPPSSSSPSPTRQYVTHRLREHADLVWDLIERRGACVLVSGSAARMPADVADALADVAAATLPPPGGDEAAAGGAPSPAAAAAARQAAGQAWVKALEASGRFRVEAWS